MRLPFVNSHAFIIGIDEYDHVSHLQTAVNDAEMLAEKLAEEHDYIIHGPLLNPTKSELENYLKIIIPEKVGKEDRVLFYFAGHGIALDSKKGPNGYLVPSDAQSGKVDSLLAMEELHEVLTNLPCRHGLLILDCCFSGAFRWASRHRDFVFDLPSVIYEQRFNQYLKDPAWQVITSSASDQKAVDVLENHSLGFRGEAAESHSPFALALLAGIGGEADMIPKDKGDGVITASELYTYLRDRVEDLTMSESRRQSPSFFSLKKHDKGQYVFVHPRHPFNLPPLPDRNPFMGLKSFDEADASLFFGRDRVITTLKELISKHQLVVVSGASGTGKSSVIKAGLLPALKNIGWTILPVIRPGTEPMHNLEEKIPNIKTAITLDTNALLIIDQYEELITQCLDEKNKETFEEKLALWIKNYNNLHIILSIRSDFEPQFEDNVLSPLWKAGRYNVPSFSNDELREIIIKPTIQEVLFFEPDGLVEDLVDAVNQAPGALPLLSFTLSELYYAYLKSGRINRSLTEEDYLKLGGVIGALRNRADAVYNNLEKAEQKSMQQLMLRMVSLEGGELAGKRIFKDEVQFSDKAETKSVEKIAKQLVQARLVQQGTDSEGQIFIEPAHDALVRAWKRLWEWVNIIGKEKLTLQNKLTIAVNDYEEILIDQPKKANQMLWHNNPRLDLLAAELVNPKHGFNIQEETFVRKSMKLRARKIQQFVWSLIGIALVGFILAGVAYSFYNKAETTLTELKAKQKESMEERSKNFVNVGIASMDKLNYDIAIKEFKLAIEEIDTFKKKFLASSEALPIVLARNRQRADSLIKISNEKNQKKDAFQDVMKESLAYINTGLKSNSEENYLFYLKARASFQTAIDNGFDKNKAQNAYEKNERVLDDIKRARIRKAEDYLSLAKSLNDKDLFQKAYDHYTVADTISINPLDSLITINFNYANKHKS